MDYYFLYIETSGTTPIWEELNFMLHFGKDLCGRPCAMTTPAYSTAKTGSKDGLLHLVMSHTTPRDIRCRQSLADLGYIDRGHNKQWAHTVPHVVLLIEFRVWSCSKIDLMLFKFIQG